MQALFPLLMAKTLAKMGHHEKKSVEFSIKAVDFMKVEVGIVNGLRGKKTGVECSFNSFI